MNRRYLKIPNSELLSIFANLPLADKQRDAEPEPPVPMIYKPEPNVADRQGTPPHIYGSKRKRNN